VNKRNENNEVLKEKKKESFDNLAISGGFRNINK